MCTNAICKDLEIPSVQSCKLFVHITMYPQIIFKLTNRCTCSLQMWKLFTVSVLHTTNSLPAISKCGNSTSHFQPQNPANVSICSACMTSWCCYEMLNLVKPTNVTSFYDGSDKLNFKEKPL